MMGLLNAKEAHDEHLLGVVAAAVPSSASLTLESS